ncbi:MAG: endonuclease/exonuclease/phosphatase family protein [Anaerolineales bacterium]|nr:endonuclease/exonuclease/phosphatase family protein [Chloroflexota bacterium]MBL6982253.1 endonuclease/exonuclease/phosphatase family protein [Anaerolineales bacterium]
MADITLFGIFFLFFFQLISDFVEAIYAFGLMGTSIPPEIVSVLFLFSPLLLLFFRKGVSEKSIWVFGGLVLFSRQLTPLMDTRGVMILSGIGVGAFLLFLPALIWNRKTKPTTIGSGLALGVSLSILFRTLNSGFDISLDGLLEGVGWILTMIAAVLMVKIFAGSNDEGCEDIQPSGFRKVWVGSIGLVAVLILFYYALTAPNVIARWTGANYLMIVALMAAVLVATSLLFTYGSRFLRALSPGILLFWNLCFSLALVMTILPHQIKFPADPGVYPLYEPAVAPLWSLATIGMIVLFPVLLIDFVFLYGALADSKPSPKALGGSFALASLFFLVMIFAQVFTTVYDYIPVVGPFFRDKFWLVFLVLGVITSLTVITLRKETITRMDLSVRETVSSNFIWVFILIGLGSIFGVKFREAELYSLPPDQRNLEILTYNIQQGYSESGQKNFKEQFSLIRKINADIIGLQESDTNRISGGNADIVRYFADRLNMYSYYGPKVVPGTFGIALLSRYPIENPRTFYMFSEAEQTATIVAQITVEDQTFNIFVTHLGNGGPLIQQEHFLTEIVGMENVIAMGDFNFNPESEQYQLTTQTLDDAWLIRWPDDVDDDGVHLDKRIDHIFVSPGTQIVDARYILSPASDHPAMVVEIEW